MVNPKPCDYSTLNYSCLHPPQIRQVALHLQAYLSCLSQEHSIVPLSVCATHPQNAQDMVP